MKFITVAIPCYSFNREYISKAIDSVLKQHVESWQLIIIDGSECGLGELKSLVLSLEHEQVVYLRNEGDVSMAGNWNFGLAQANSELVTLLHDDDTLHPDYVKDMLAFSQKYPNSAAYYCDVNLIDGEGEATWTVADQVKSLITPKQPITHIKSDSGLASLLKGCFIFCPTVCYRKSKIPKQLFNNKWKMVTDFQSYYDLLKAGFTISGTNKKLYNYRRHNNNQTAKLTQNMLRFDEEIMFYHSVANELEGIWPLSANIARSKRMIKLHLLFLMMKALFSFNMSRVKSLAVYYKQQFFS